MSIFKINNNFYLSQSRRNLSSQSLKNFKASENAEISDNFEDENENTEIINKFSENDLIYLSTKEPDKRFNKVAANAVKALFVTIPLLDTVLQGVLKGGNLSSKVLKSASTAGKWGAVFAAGASVSGVKSFLNSESKNLDNFDKKHGTLSTVIDFAAIYTAYNFVLNSSKTAMEYTKNSFPNITAALKNNFKQPIKNILNNSIVNKKLIQPAEKIFSKRPYLVGLTKMASYLLVPAAAISVLVRFNKEANLRNEKVAGNYTALKIVNDMLPVEE